AAEGEPGDRRGPDRQGRAVRGPDDRSAQSARGRAPDLRDARRPLGDRGPHDGAPGRRPGARDPRARQGRRAAQDPAQALTNAQPTPALPSRAVTSRRPSAPALLALGAALAGAVGIASALTPEFADRFDLVRGVLPPGVPEAARALALAFGIVLIWLSRGLARRRHRAWKLALGVVLASAVAHMAKGLDFEESIATLVLLAALWRWRAEFWVRGDPATRWPLAQ